MFEQQTIESEGTGTPEEEPTVEELEHISIFGFDGKVPNSLKIHPQRKHIIFPLGNKVSILSIQSNKQEFLCGHTNTITAIDISKCGNYIASGQISHMGFRSYVILWNWSTKKEFSRHELHKVQVQSLCFTSDGKYLISLGGRDDGKLVVWDVEKRVALCGASAKKEVTGPANYICSLRKVDFMFLACGEQNLRIWCIDETSSKLRVLDANLGKLRRHFTAMKVKSNDSILYAGTTSGDIVKIQLNCFGEDSGDFCKAPVLVGCYGRHNPKKAPGKDCESYMNGVRDLVLVNNEKQLLIGAGDGCIELVEERNVKIKDYPQPTWPMLRAIKRKRVNGSVTSLEIYDKSTVFIGTDTCEIYTLDYQNFVLRLEITCNTSIVYDIAFPNNFSLVFATASYQSVRVWSLMKKKELLRIIVPNFAAVAVVFSYDGRSIITGWNDGVIRSFTPLTGKLQYAIPNAHNKGCSALAMSSCDTLLLSGGCEGQIRIWKVDSVHQSLVSVLKEHTAPVASLHFNCFDREIVSSSSDGTCIIWDLRNLTRKHVLYANTQFTCAKFYPTGVQVLATGTDRRISYWEVFDGSLVRDVEGSTSGSINCLSINSSGEMFVSGSSDQIIKLWDYQTAIPVCAGIAHAASIVTCCFSPCGRYIISGSADGALIIWRVPEKYWPKANVDPLKPTPPDAPKKLSKYDKQPEDIKQLETSRSNKDIHISECPPIKTESNVQPTNGRQSQCRKSDTMSSKKSY